VHLPDNTIQQRYSAVAWTLKGSMNPSGRGGQESFAAQMSVPGTKVT
jgi:hypothetical protein